MYTALASLEKKMGLKYNRRSWLCNWSILEDGLWEMLSTKCDSSTGASIAALTGGGSQGT